MTKSVFFAAAMMLLLGSKSSAQTMNIYNSYPSTCSASIVFYAHDNTSTSPCSLISSPAISVSPMSMGGSGVVINLPEDLNRPTCTYSGSLGTSWRSSGLPYCMGTGASAGNTWDAAQITIGGVTVTIGSATCGYSNNGSLGVCGLTGVLWTVDQFGNAAVNLYPN